MVQISERYKSLQLVNPINTDHAMFTWRGKPVLFFSKTLLRYQNSKILWCSNVIALSNSYKFIYVYQVIPSLPWIGIFVFPQDSFYVKLVIIMFIRMFEIQYWKCNNICNTWKIEKGKTKNLNVGHLFFFISMRENSLQPRICLAF